MEGAGHRGTRRPLAVALAAALLPAAAAAPAPGEGGAPPLAVPAVPYVPQSDALCGGAALAMVLRYWGASGVHAEDFAAALLPSGGGIATGTLARLAEERGFSATAWRGDAATVAAQLEKGRPLVALAGRDGAPSGHYVVLLAWANHRVLVHDPAVGPFRVWPEAQWLDRWSAADRWTLLVLPPAPRDAAPPEPVPAEASRDECGGRVRAAIEEADRGDVESARRALAAAADRCAASSAPLRELAGLEFRRENWAGAAELAERAVARREDDALAWRLLATSRFLGGLPDAALEAWNEVGEPRLDLVEVEGLDRTPFRAVYDAIGAGAERVLTAESLRRASRRVAELPTAEGSRVGYRPLAGGRARLEVSIVERPTLEPLRPLLVETALRAVADRATRVSVANATRGGDRARVLWQWEAHRPRVALAVEAPRALGLPGIVTAEASWDEQSYLLGGAGGVARERRWRGSLSVDEWWRSDTRLGATVAVDEWTGRGRFASLAARVDRRLAGDRVSLGGWLAGWAGAGAPFQAGGARLSVRSRASTTRPVVRLDAAYEGAGPRAPLALWPGAGTGRGRDLLLRAHPLLREGVVAGDGFGRELVSGRVEGEAPVASLGPFRVTGALFVDAARVLVPLTGRTASPTLVDVGAGVRVRLPGTRSALRVDVGTPWDKLRPRLSVGWQREWPD